MKTMESSITLKQKRKRKMTIRDKRYFEWLCSLVTTKRRTSYKKLLEYLHNWEFTWVMPLDSNRAADGLELRRKYYDYRDDTPQYPCTVLEMMIALSVRCEDSMMVNDAYGNRTGEWFWNMIFSLGLNTQFDSRFNPNYVDEVLNNFVNRNYEPDGTGCLFRTSNQNVDMRKLDIWYQMQYYLDDILDD